MLITFFIGVDDAGTVGCYVLEIWVWQHAGADERRIGELIGDDEDNGEDEDDVAIRKEGVRSALYQCPKDKPCCYVQLIAKELEDVVSLVRSSLP